MNSKTVVTAIVGAIAGLSLAVGTVAFAHNTDHMGNIQGDTMMGQTYQHDTKGQNTHGGMHAQSNQGQHSVTGHHTGNSQATGNFPCHANTGVKSTPKT
ncbi:MAG: hypothetical protein ACC657_00420, partial [Thiohalomonadales bacterium]